MLLNMDTYWYSESNMFGTLVYRIGLIACESLEYIAAYELQLIIAILLVLFFSVVIKKLTKRKQCDITFEIDSEKKNP